MTVVCYRPDPTPRVDEKLNFVEASSFDGVGPAILPEVSNSSASPSLLDRLLLKQSKFCIPRDLAPYHQSLEAYPRKHALSTKTDLFSTPGASDGLILNGRVETCLVRVL